MVLPSRCRPLSRRNQHQSLKGNVSRCRPPSRRNSGVEMDPSREKRRAFCLPMGTKCGKGDEDAMCLWLSALRSPSSPTPIVQAARFFMAKNTSNHLELWTLLYCLTIARLNPSILVRVAPEIGMSATRFVRKKSLMLSISSCDSRSILLNTISAGS